MSDETTSPQQSPLTSSVGDRGVPTGPPNRLALLALIVLFCLISALWGWLLYYCWEIIGLQKVVALFAVFVVFMAVVHFVGYRLWRRQFVDDQGGWRESPLSPLAPAYRPAIKTALLQQGIILVLARLVADMGETFNAAVIALAAYWLAFGIVVFRRARRPTRGDILLVRYGFLLIFVIVLTITYLRAASGR